MKQKQDRAYTVLFIAPLRNFTKVNAHDKIMLNMTYFRNNMLYMT